MKKMLAAILAAVFCFLTFSGCGASEKKRDAAIDIDFTAFSSTVAYAQLSALLMHPEEYAGKTVKIDGTYFSNYYDITDSYYHYILIEDSTACCSQAIEFALSTHGQGYPDEDGAVGGYPIPGELIEIVGIISSYEELGHEYFYILAENYELKF